MKVTDCQSAATKETKADWAKGWSGSNWLQDC